mmetsp:Transcript_29448/g.68597  ORF Transcript_29448/g.68597 Transcript_29448/m.68597 type:complete len:117 (-) Transcript_29448:110-460(-)
MGVVVHVTALVTALVTTAGLVTEVVVASRKERGFGREERSVLVLFVTREGSVRVHEACTVPHPVLMLMQKEPPEQLVAAPPAPPSGGVSHVAVPCSGGVLRDAGAEQLHQRELVLR